MKSHIVAEVVVAALAGTVEGYVHNDAYNGTEG